MSSSLSFLCGLGLIEGVGMARKAAHLCPEAPAGSVDFAKAVDGTWYLFDMASARDSWHPKNCLQHGLIHGHQEAE